VRPADEASAEIQFPRSTQANPISAKRAPDHFSRRASKQNKSTRDDVVDVDVEARSLCVAACSFCGANENVGARGGGLFHSLSGAVRADDLDKSDVCIRLFLQQQPLRGFELSQPLQKVTSHFDAIR
jgi:hypothetical protein